MSPVHNYCVSVATFTLLPPNAPLPDEQHILNFLYTHILHYPNYRTARQINCKYLALTYWGFLELSMLYVWSKAQTLSFAESEYNIKLLLKELLWLCGFTLGRYPKPFCGCSISHLESLRLHGVCTIFWYTYRVGPGSQHTYCTSAYTSPYFVQVSGF